jgi:hypothetical protein
MGERAVTFYVKYPSYEQVAKAMQAYVESEAYVFPSVNGWVSIFDRSSDVQPEYTKIHSITEKLSREFQTPSLSFIVLSGVYFLYLLYDNGQLVSSFSTHSLDSIEDAFCDYPCGILSDDEACGRFLDIGDSANSLAHYCLSQASVEVVQSILESARHSDDNIFDVPELDCIDAVCELAPLLGILPEIAMLGFIGYQRHGVDSETARTFPSFENPTHIIKL